MDKCAVCHQENGLRLKNEDSTGAYYLYPPLWGDVVIIQELECIVYQSCFLY